MCMCFSQDVVNDIEGAQKIGMRGILVKTGIAVLSHYQLLKSL